MARGPQDIETNQNHDVNSGIVRANDLERKIDEWLERQPHGDGKYYAYPLPWFAHENSEILELLIPRYKPLWRDIRLVRAHGCIKIVFVR